MKNRYLRSINSRIVRHTYSLFILFLLFPGSAQLIAQSDIQVDQPFSGWTYYPHATRITDREAAPTNIREAADHHLKQRLGTFLDSVTFSHGQIIDLTRHFQKYSERNYPQYIVPAYDFQFKLSNQRIGLKRYYLNLKLDQYGQLLKFNWPTSGVQVKEEVLDRQDIKTFIMRSAQARVLNPHSFELSCQYRADINQLVWVFRFKSFAFLPRNNVRHTLEVPWKSLTISRKYEQEAVFLH